MNLLDKKWINRGNLKVEYLKDKMIIENNYATHKFLVYPHVFKNTGSREIFFNIQGNLIEGTGCTLKVLNRQKTILGQCGLNSFWGNQLDFLKYYILTLYIPAKSKMEITKLDHEFEIPSNFFDSFLSNDTLLITPGYPSLEDKYNTAFVHTRVKAYKNSNINLDVVVCNQITATSTYSFEDVKVVTCNYFQLREILKSGRYKKVLIHFFDNNYANILESVDTSKMQLYFYLHGAETLYRDWSKIASPYFGPEVKIDNYLESLFQIKDFYIKKYNNMSNAKWIFVTEWTKQRCEELLNIKFNNYDIIPCLIDTSLFKYEQKDIEQRKKIFVLRKFVDVNSYSLDTVVRIILELSHREIFNDLEFDIYGDGPMHERILQPLNNFKNVHISKKFLNHKEIREVHQSHGIALFPTRFDSQAVSSCEAASSGCAVITSDIPGTRQFIPNNLGVLCSTENYKEYADVIEKMYNEPDYFIKVAHEESNSVQNKFDYEHTIAKEITMFKNDLYNYHLPFDNILDNPVLSIIIPSYNVQNFLKHTVFSIVDQPNANKMEVLIINDGSVDNTAKIAEELKQKYSINGKSIIKVINKENGGHGSTINVGIKESRGKYIKVIDGDDTVDSEELCKLIDILEKENSDIVLNNYIEDFAKTNYANIMKIYDKLKPGIQYRFDDLCYDDYGFYSWGPILACSSYKSEMLKKGNFKLSEKMFYVDMELNINVAVLCSTLTYYDLNVYRYLLGRPGQSVNMDSYKRNYKHHETVCINMIKIYNENKDKLSESKKNYIEKKLILPMLSTQYEICINYYNKPGPFQEYDSILKQHPYFYNNNKIKIKKVKFHRFTNGYFIFLNDIFMKYMGFIKRLIRR